MAGGESGHLPYAGVGPLYVVAIIGVTVLGIALGQLGLIPCVGWPVPNAARIALGIALVVLGVAMWLAAFFGAGIDDGIRENQLVTTGVYAWVRNPIYVAFAMACTGVIVMADNVWLLALPLLFWAFLTLLMRHTEERWLLDLHGSVYRAYCERVNRCIPWLPRRR